jgi:hypothetical protein
MKRALVALIALTLFLTACATTSTTPSLRGTITERKENVITVAAAEGNQTANVSLTRGTLVYWQSGLEAQRADLVAGQRVKVWYNGAEATTPVAARVVIEP